MDEVPSAGGAVEVRTTATVFEPVGVRPHDAVRMRSLAQLGLGAQADPQMQAVAERVHRWLDVPVALVTLVGSDRHVFPGTTGLPEPWASSRSAPLRHLFCPHVVTTTEPLIVSDARGDPLLQDSPAVDELGVVAYAAMPLTDEAGTVLGALCAIDSAPREWTAAHLDLLRGLAETCSTELRLRLSRFSAREERRHRDDLEQRLQGSFDRSQALLAASEAFSDTVTVEDVRQRVSELVKTELRPSYVGLVLLDDARAHAPDSRHAAPARGRGHRTLADLRPPHRGPDGDGGAAAADRRLRGPSWLRRRPPRTGPPADPRPRPARDRGRAAGACRRAAGRARPRLGCARAVSNRSSC